jgi:hypothetical protein
MLAFFFNKESRYDSDPVLVLGECRSDAMISGRVLEIPELLYAIIGYLDLKYLALVCRVSKKWREMATPLLYRHVCFYHDSKRLIAFLRAVNPHAMIEGNSVTNWYLEIVMRTWRKRRVQSQTFARSYLDEEKERLETKYLSESICSSALVIPHCLGQRHRFQNTVYGFIPLHSSKKLKNEFVMSNDTSPCLMLSKKHAKTHWSVPKALLYHCFGPFLKSIVLAHLDLAETYFISFFSELVNLNVVTIRSCDGVTDDVLLVLAKASKVNLCNLTLENQSLISDMALHYISRNCPNLQSLCATNTNNITETGIKDILVMCPFLHSLTVNQFSLGSGLSINKRIVPYLVAYGISLTSLAIAGCSIKEPEILTLIESIPRIRCWQFGFPQIGTKKMSEIKQKLKQWFRSPVVKHAILEKQLVFVLENQKRVSLACKDRINILVSTSVNNQA